MRCPGGGSAAGGDFARRARKIERGRGGDDPVEIEIALRHVGEAVEPRGEVGVLGGLHQAEMAFRRREAGIALHGAEHRHSRRRHRIGDERLMARAADPVEHDARDPHRRIVGRKPARHRSGRLRLAGHVEHEQHRQAEPRGKVGRRAAAAGRGRRRRRTGPSRPR